MKRKSDIQLILDEMNIFSYEDYQEKMKVWEDFDYRVFKDGQDKIDALRDAVVQYYQGYRYNQINGQYISVNPSV